MQLLEAKKQFVQAWGALGSQWGINKTMAQIHALMMVSTEPLSTEEIMEELSISRGNANMNIRELTDWGLVTKVFKAGERRDYFVGEKEVWKIAKQVAKIRKTRELDPILKLLEQLKTVNAHIKNDELKHFQKMVNDVHKLAVNVDRLIESIFKAEESWFWDKILKIFTK
ncbi:MAG: transcriptional regulator [Chitinophagales bacterium]|nr:transcriptional regulator [Chitinophagales bacterium]HMV14303.1 transcriptional regulator [Chitinophagales bacterium]HMW11845.1 transcriptional regulator [Chitinophagales bacterium]HMX59026.1 transcriptional regulator [Chitinophagales bacterium]HMY24438.1 transcriptional regulator [Chitinophagales bacterium]